MTGPTQAPEGDEVDVVRCRWRVGRRVGRTIYAQFAAKPSDLDRLIGVMDTPLYASAVVLAHNAALDRGLLP